MASMRLYHWPTCGEGNGIRPRCHDRAEQPAQTEMVVPTQPILHRCSAEREARKPFDGWAMTKLHVLAIVDKDVDDRVTRGKTRCGISLLTRSVIPISSCV